MFSVLGNKKTRHLTVFAVTAPSKKTLDLRSFHHVARYIVVVCGSFNATVPTGTVVVVAEGARRTQVGAQSDAPGGRPKRNPYLETKCE